MVGVLIWMIIYENLCTCDCDKARKIDKYLAAVIITCCLYWLLLLLLKILKGPKKYISILKHHQKIKIYDINNTI